MFNHFKKISITTITLILLSQSVIAADSTIHIKGYMWDNTCGVAPGSQDQVVDLLNNALKQMYKVGEVTPIVPFYIELSPCGEAATAVKVGFSGIADISNTTLLAIEPGGQNASGVGIQILDGNRVPMAINATSDYITWTPLVAGKNNTLHFYARLMTSKLPVIAGHIHASATFTLEFQ